MPIKEHDVVIIGMGPSGLMAAKTLIEDNPQQSILLIDKNPPAYRKPCGGGVPDECLATFPFLNTQGLISHTTTILTAVNGARGREFPVRINMIPRDAMRSLMLSNILCNGIDLMFNSVATDIDVDERIVTVNNHFKVHYNFLIGADGASSRVAKAIGFQFNKVPLIVSRHQCGEYQHKRDHAYIIFLPYLPGGYAWKFPKGDHVNMGMGGNIPGKKLKESFDKYLHALTRHAAESDMPRIAELDRSAHLIPSEYVYDPVGISPTVIHDHIILCGDAATFVNPMTGEGIYFALLSGVEAAEIILGKRTPVEYPSFHQYLSRVQELRREVNAISIEDAFDKIFMDPATSHDTVTFLFSHDIPKPRKYSEKEKEQIYDNL